MKTFVLLLLFLATGGAIYSQGNPEVLSVQPVQQSLSADPSTPIEIIFDQAVDPTSFSDTTFMVWGRWSGIHKGKLSFNSTGNELFFNPEKDFFYSEWITISLSKGIKNEGGDHLDHGYTWNFWIKSMTGSLDLTRTSTIEIRQPGEGWIQTYGTYAGDLDGDGWSDFIVPNEIPNDICVFLNNGNGEYNSFSVFQISNCDIPGRNEGMDFNLDGLMDFAVGNSTIDIVAVFIGDGNGGFIFKSKVNVGSHPRQIAAGDVNNAGR